ncbi:alpha/beta fold hydrolase [Acidovorax sp. BL-A-41-H1]|uniref:alpha/beta fold hydrolase n=1 Tax=Acidovorax sp. BL-A-41-H1 TaxID=3421102 RepID=UPI003F78E1DB
MPSFTHNHTTLHYEVHGTGQPVLMLHGLTVSFKGNFERPGWVAALVRHGFQVVGLDFPGHGLSDKPHDPAAYGTVQLASHALALLDHLQIPRAALLGYSMGSVVALHLLHNQPARCHRAVLVAAGDGLLGHPPHSMAQITPRLVEALERPAHPADLPDHIGMYWTLATSIGGDRAASAAAAKAAYPPCTTAEAGRVQSDVLVISGERDLVLGRGPVLAGALPRGQYLEIAGADHFMLAVHPGAQDAAATFLAGSAPRSPVASAALQGAAA